MTDPRSINTEEPLERPLSKASAKIVRDAILAIRAASIGTLLYPAGNAMRIDLENRAYGLLLKILQNDPTMTISNVEGKTLVNGFAPKNVDVKNTLGFTLISLMEDYGMSSITFKRDLRREEFADFLHCLTNPEEESLQDGGSTALKKRGVIHIKIDQVRYEKMSEVAKRAIGIKGTKGEGLPMAKLSKDNLLDMPIEQYADPAISGKLGLITEALILNKNNEKVKNIVDKFAGDLNAANTEDKTVLTEGAIRLSEPLITHEKAELLETLTKALLNRFNSAQQSKEFIQLCDGLQAVAIQLLDKGNFSQAVEIINRFKEQIMAGSPRPQEQKKIAEENLQKIAHPKAIEALVSAFKGKLEFDDYHNITEVLAALGEHALKPMLDILTREELEEKDPFELYVMRHSVAMILKKMGQPVKDALKRMLTDNRNYVVKNVIEMIGYIGSEEFVPMLTPFLHAASLQIRMQCVATLKKIGGRASLEALTEGLKDKDEDVKQASSLAIAELADQSFVKELKGLLADKSTENIAKKTIQKIETKKKK